ncbi:hypothetical protein BDD12DRAFT_874129 [Trichophaea hybrida]|nr:hypothetical protein BDD12DRAFT_874129 [Trichophaea hybrida]
MPLFAIASFDSTDDENDDEHLLQMTDILGDLPEGIFNKWTRENRCFGPNRQQINSCVNGEPDDGEFRFDSLEKYFHSNKPSDLDDREAEIIIALIRKILQYDPEKRPSAADLVRDPWFIVEDPQ